MLYNTLVRLLFVGMLWLISPHFIDQTGYVPLLGILLSSYLLDLGYIRFLLHPLTLLVNRKLQVVPDPKQVDLPPLVTTTRELIQLDGHLNDLMRRVKSRFECEKAFTAYASHALLTPISVLRSRFDNLIIDEQTPPHIAIRLVESQQTLLRLSKIIQLLLRLARIENHQYLKNETVSIRTILQEVLYDLKDRISLKPIRVDVSIDEDIVLTKGNKILIHSMLLNLISNAVRYNSPKGRLSIGRGQIGNLPTLTIEDTGPGMMPDHVAALTQYGHPTQSSSESTGIGLQLTLTIATFHHIKLTVDTQLPLSGTRITLTFA